MNLPYSLTPGIIVFLRSLKIAGRRYPKQKACNSAAGINEPQNPLINLPLNPGMHKFIIALALMIPITVTAGENKIDSLKQVLSEQTVEDEHRLKTLISLAHKYNEVNSDSASRYAKLAMELAKHINEPEQLGRAMIVMGVAEERRGNFDQALLMYESVLQLGDSVNSTSLKGKAHTSLGTYHFARGNLRKAIHHGNAALRFIEPTQYSRIATIDYNLGLAYSYLNLSDSAALHFNHGIEMAEKTMDWNDLGINYSGLSIVYYLEQRIPEATQAALKASEYLEKAGNLYQLIGSLNTLGICYYMAEDYPAAIRSYNKALALAKQCSSIDQQSEMYRNLATAYADMGDYQKAFEYADTTIQIRDSLYAVNKEKILTETETRFNLERKERDIQLLSKQAEIKEATLSRQRQLVWGLVIFGILSLVILLVLWRNNKLRKRTNELLEIEKAYEQTIRQQLEFKNQKLTHENTIAQFQILKNQVDPHFIFNALNILSTLVENDPKQASEFIRSLSILFRSMLEIRDESTVTLQQELKHTKAYLHLQEVRFGNNLHIEYDIDPACLGLLLPPFSLQQVVENAIKHNQISSKDPLTIHIRAYDHTLTVENGLRPRINATPSTKTGIANIRDRYQMLGGQTPVFEERGPQYHAMLPLLEH